MVNKEAWNRGLDPIIEITMHGMTLTAQVYQTWVPGSGCKVRYAHLHAGDTQDHTDAVRNNGGDTAYTFPHIEDVVIRMQKVMLARAHQLEQEQ